MPAFCIRQSWAESIDSMRLRQVLRGVKTIDYRSHPAHGIGAQAGVDLLRGLVSKWLWELV